MAARLGRRHLAFAAGCLGVLAMVGAIVGAAATLPVSSERLTSVAQGGTVPPPSDTTPPQLSTLQFFDVNSDGKIDRVVATFTDASDLATYTAGTTPWTLSGQPAGVSLLSVSVATATKTATLTLSEGSVFDTAATGFQVAMAANAAGIRDVHGNQASFGATSVADKAGPVPWRTQLVHGGGGSAGRINAGDRVDVTWSEMLRSTSLCAAWTATPYTATGLIVDATNNHPDTGTDTVAPRVGGTCAAGLAFGLVDLTNNYVTTNEIYGSTGGGSTMTYTPATRVVSLALGAGSTSNPNNNNAHGVSFRANAAVTDLVGNAAPTGWVVSDVSSRF